MPKRLRLILCLSLMTFSVNAMTDSELMAEVARTGQLLKQMQFDSTLVMVDSLLPVARENNHALAQAILHAIAGSVLNRTNRRSEGMQASMRSVALVEQHQLLKTAINDSSGIILALFSSIYGELTLRFQEQGNTVEALHYAQTALRWVSHIRQPDQRVGIMSCIVPSLAANKELRPAYNLMKQSFAEALQLKQYDFALMMAAYLMQCEDECFGRGPEACEWMKRADEVIPKAVTKEAVQEYEKTRQALLDKYSGATARVGDGMQADSLTADKTRLTDLERTLPNDTARYPHAEKKTALPENVNRNDSEERFLPWTLLEIACLLMACLSVWYYRHRSRNRKKESARLMAEKYAEGREYERNRLARELHDGVSNQLLAVEMKLSTDGLTPDTMQLLDESREQVRRVSHELVQPEFTRATLSEVLAAYVAEMNGISHCNISFSVSPRQADWSKVPAAMALEIYRIVQELIANALKHSSADVISVGLHQDGKKTIMVLVSDNGADKPGKPAGTGGIGLRNMKQRAETIGGTLELMRHQYGRVAKLVVCLPQ